MHADESTATPLKAAWPLFGLRIRSERLVLRLPTDDDLPGLLDLAKAGIHPPAEMPFGVAWTDATGAAFDQGYLQHHWKWRGSWRPEEWWLNLMVEWEGRPIGAQTISGEDFAIHRTVDSGSWLGQAYQGRGFGKEMRSAVLSFAFDGLGARFATSGGVPRQRRIERGLAQPRLRGERPRLVGPARGRA